MDPAGQTLHPADEAQLAEAVAAAVASETPVAVAGGGTRSGLGRPVEAGALIDTRGMSGVLFYEPGELVLSARAGTPLAEIVAMLDAEGQELACEPMDFAALSGLDPAEASGTLGGMVAAGVAGPRRIRAGAVRDHVLGFRCVTGRAEPIKSGGRVMKNVTGYDLSKLVTASHGTLCVLTEVTVKVLPKPETQATLVLHGLDDAAAVAALTRASGTPHEGSSFAHVPEGTSPDGIARTAIRLEGPEVSVSARVADMIRDVAGSAETSTLDAGASATFWNDLRDGLPVVAGEGQVWRISVAPTAGPVVMTAIRAAGVPVLAHAYDWAGGLIWLRVEAAGDAHADAIRAAVAAAGGGHATLFRADDDVRRAVPVFQPQPSALAALTARVKHAFDPVRVLNRGRMREDL
ncbi:glycolate oxidase subunit GlcE [Futiania mangrovi]|uniref:Glycolate oxidase subunit GlcE n=1 Tax=Futiania mangrovi TaxID=2959716 RepID=A0A9J6P8H2_9PROT|nr:glycolate oxidase subunit GlcE [Futiania mangrovii]MCP1334837.1 glycolate oxidase subunit GlcE [Futiania mangrovii]